MWTLRIEVVNGKKIIYSNVAVEEIAKQFPTERREMIFCAIHMTEKLPLFFACDDRKVAVLVLDGYRRQLFFFSIKPKKFVLQL
jgi:hypothetical protein